MENAEIIENLRDTASELLDEIQLKEETIADLKDQIVVLEDKHKEAIEKLEDKIEDISDDLDTAKNNRRHYEDKCEELKDEIRDLKDELPNQDKIEEYLWKYTEEYNLTGKPVVIAEIWYKKVYITFE